MIILSNSARNVIRQSTVIYAGDVGFHVPQGVPLTPAIQQELEQYVRHLRGPVNEAANAVIASMLEWEGLSPHPNQPPVTV